MRKDVMKKWVKALRSRKYKQGKGQLNTKGSLCCLGVLCELAPKGLGLSKELLASGDTRYGDEVHLLPDMVMKWAGMATTCGQLPKVVRYKGMPTQELAILNDKGMPFGKIAKIIERLYKEL